MREPSPDRVAGDGVREITGLIGFAEGVISSVSGEFSAGVDELDDNGGVAAFSGSSIFPGNLAPCSSSPLADGGVDLVDPNCSQTLANMFPRRPGRSRTYEAILVEQVMVR